jgi:RNA polymerase sigma-70 factor, ECF subfamily
MPDEPLIRELLKHQSDFMGYLVAMTRDLDAAQEIFQNVAVSIMDRRGTEEIRDFRAWAKEVVRRQALLYLREKAPERVRSMEPLLLEGISQAFVEDATSAETAKSELDALRRCLAGLPEKSRALIALRYEQRASFGQIAQSLASTEIAVQRALSRVRKALRDCVRAAMRNAGEAQR